MYQVTKRDGKTVPFELDKIAKAIEKAFQAQEKQYHPTIIDMLALKVHIRSPLRRVLVFLRAFNRGHRLPY